MDNNCDGTWDETNPQPGDTCSTGLLGNCGTGTPTCVNGAIVCNQNKQPSEEICGDGQDNNCDGTWDETNPQMGATCQTGLLGVCAIGTLQCINGAIPCIPNTNASPESCDGLDNDCNGTVDNGC